MDSIFIQVNIYMYISTEIYYIKMPETNVYKSSAENQKGVITVQKCSIENQKGAIATYFVQW